MLIGPEWRNPARRRELTILSSRYLRLSISRAALIFTPLQISISSSLLYNREPPLPIAV